MHNDKLQPIPEDLKTMWDNFQLFFETIYK